jgi:probable addiction module antidote protein
MNTIFIGGSRNISRLSADVKKRIDNVINSGDKIIVGDANGADKAVQKHLMECSYEKVTVFCSGDSYRNNLGRWHTQFVRPPKSVKGFQFYAAKDREMAREADFGLMIWDGKSAGTVLNVLRLVQAKKIAVLIDIPNKSVINFKSIAQWDKFLLQCSPGLRAELRGRATPDEWGSEPKELEPSLLNVLNVRDSNSTERPSNKTEDEFAASINEALVSGDPTSVVDALGNIAREKGMTQIANDIGLEPEILYRLLCAGGNPEFATVLKVMTSVGLRLKAHKMHADFSAPMDTSD